MFICASIFVFIIIGRTKQEKQVSHHKQKTTDITANAIHHISTLTTGRSLSRHLSNEIIMVGLNKSFGDTVSIPQGEREGEGGYRDEGKILSQGELAIDINRDIAIEIAMQTGPRLAAISVPSTPTSCLHSG